MTLPTAIDHVTLAESRLPFQWRDKPIVLAYLKSLATAVQEFEDLQWDLANGLSVDTAIGNQLDLIGKLVGVSRDARDDDDYRRAIILQTIINRSVGSVETVIDAVNSYTDRTDSTIFEHPAAFCFIYLHGGIDNGVTEFFDTNIIAAGVNSKVIFDENDSVIPVDIKLYPNFLVSGGDPSLLDLSDGSQLQLSDGTFLGINPEPDFILGHTNGIDYNIIVSDQNFTLDRAIPADLAANFLDLSDSTQLELTGGSLLQLNPNSSDTVENSFSLAEAIN